MGGQGRCTLVIHSKAGDSQCSCFLPISISTLHIKGNKKGNNNIMAGTALHEKMWEGVVQDCIATPCSLNYKPVSDSMFHEKKTIAVVGTKAALEAFGKSGKLPASVSKTFDFLQKKIETNAVTVATLSHLFIEGDVEELIVGCVTEVHSRHVSSHRGDQVSQFTKRVAPKETSALVLAVTKEEAFFNYAAAASRGHSLCKLTGLNDGFQSEGRERLDVFSFNAEGEISSKRLDEAQIVAESIQLSARLVDMPTNYLNTKTYAKIMEGLARRFGFTIEVIRGEELQAKGMNVLYAVGRAAEYGSALAILTHVPENAPEDVTCWCGKGIVYDTGGLSIKSKDGMPGMKVDMGGSAGILGGFLATVRLGIPINLRALLALADNAVNELAVRNDDVVRCLSGRTIEINNTDAEGRLVLCDTIAYAHQTFNPTVVLDMATLTGAQVCSCSYL